MGIEMKAELRRFAKNALGGVGRVLRMTGIESLAVAQIEPECFELTRSGRRFYGGVQNGATGRAPVASIPTTAAAWVLWNGEPDGGAAYVIDRAHVVQVSGTAAVGGAILSALTTTKIAAPTAATGYATSSASKGGKSSRAIFADNQTLSVAPTWGVLSANGNPASVTNGGDSVEVKGRIIIPPGFAAAFHYLSGTGTTPLFGLSLDWLEIECELE